MSEIEFQVLMSNEQKTEFKLDQNCQFIRVQNEIKNRLNVDIINQRIISGGGEINNNTDFQLLKNRNPNKIIFHLNDRSATAQEMVLIYHHKYTHDMDCIWPKPKPISQDIPAPTAQTVPEPEISKKYKFAWVLLANISECLKALDQGILSSQRKRINNIPEDIVFTNMDVQSSRPKVDDLGLGYYIISGANSELYC